MAERRQTYGDQDLDTAVRLAAFEFLGLQSRIHPETLPWQVPTEGFTFEGRRVPLVGPAGIFKPAILEIPLSIMTAPDIPGRREDGPMLKHGLQGFQGATITVPRRVALQPNRGFLEQRFDQFRKAS